MISLPLIVGDANDVNNLTVNVTINFRNVEVRENVLNSGAKGISYSDVVVGKTIIKGYDADKKVISNPREVTNAIRKIMNYNTTPANYVIVNTKKYEDSDFYDSYIIPMPFYKPNEINDYIYGMLVNSIRFSNPSDVKKEKLSLKALGFDELFNGELLSKMQMLRNSNQSSLYIRNQLMNAGYDKQLEVLDFFNSLDCKIEENDVILTSELDNVIRFFDSTKKESKALANYKNIALGNYEGYLSLAALNVLVNGKVLDWLDLSEKQKMLLSEKQKVLIYKFNHNERAA